MNTSNEYLTNFKNSDPLLQNIKCNCLSVLNGIEICGEIDINIEESTGLIYDDDLDQALVHMQIALRKLHVKTTLLITLLIDCAASL